MESPFHHRGHISPKHEAAWRAMHWHEPILERIITDLQTNPPEYVSVMAPLQGGKTTWA